MISGDFMTELELLFYVSWSVIFLFLCLNKNGDEIESFSEIAWVLFSGTLFLGIFHQILKTICFRIPWYELFFH